MGVEPEPLHPEHARLDIEGANSEAKREHEDARGAKEALEAARVAFDDSYLATSDARATTHGPQACSRMRASLRNLGTLLDPVPVEPRLIAELRTLVGRSTIDNGDRTGSRDASELLERARV